MTPTTPRGGGRASYNNANDSNNNNNAACTRKMTRSLTESCCLERPSSQIL